MTKRICECISDEDFRNEIAEFMSRINSRHPNHLCPTSMLFFAFVLAAQAQNQIENEAMCEEIAKLAIIYSHEVGEDLIARTNSKIERLQEDGTSTSVN